ncbi:3-hydroxylacyl-(Acyl carrier protein) dehydratase [Candidatus Terasakiella magnetica]|nr:3-hydroxylacyl-(Acyl carrier protein) dehydratase [Candidatus Terasakiella magnetica]
MMPCPWPLERLLPHAPPMVLLDEVLDADETGARAAVTIRSDHPFWDGEKLPAHVGIELMAQTCGVFAGAKALAAGQPARLGFLLGSRDYRALVAGFGAGDRLEIVAQAVFLDDGMAVFDCRIEQRGAVVAEAQLTLYQPADGDAVLQKLRGHP